MYVKQEEFHLNVRKNKEILKELASFLTTEIQARRAAPSGWDFRFMVIVAQWLVEQGGYTMTPEGNNPGNVVGEGDAGFFQRPYNKEFNPKTGVLEPHPEVKFARYSSMKHATNKKFDHLRESWPQAYEALLSGGSADDYVKGLYPGWPKNYATAPKQKYIDGVRFRLNRTIDQYIMAAEDDLKEIDVMASAIPGREPVPGESLDYRNSAVLNQNMRSIVVNLIDELKKLKLRVRDAKPLRAG